MVSGGKNKETNIPVVSSAQKPEAQTKNFVPGKQRNHGGYFLPPEVAWLGKHPPFWLAVAHWCIAADRAVNRDELAATFHVTPRQAADVMTYILHSCPRVDCIKKVQHKPGGRRICLMRVFQVREEANTQCVEPCREKVSSPVSSETLSILKNRFLRRQMQE